eukprot:GHRR01017481.1.p1 GENE.GHRR01017481.1~~GHRR01017481.1.p1  ORF type:complete len:191 (+),score=51.28 GHRR01017481.1:152-724(+)
MLSSSSSTTSKSVLESLKEGGALQFVGGLVLGFFLRSVTSVLSKDLQASSSSTAKKKSSGASSIRPAAASYPREELKMVLVVNQSLNMGKGKIGAQCAHAAAGVIGKYRRNSEQLFKWWERCGQPKIALKVPDEQRMNELAQKALQQELPAYIVCDAGRTQVAAGSQTVLAIGPGYKSDIDNITGHLSLL